MRYFIAFTFSEAENARIEPLRHEIATRFSVLAAIKTPPHITILRKLEATNGIGPLQEAIAALFAQTAPLTIRVNGFSSFDQSAWFLEVEQARQIRNVHRSLADIAYQLYQVTPNRPVESKQFHITLAYKDVGPETFKRIGEFLKEQPLPIEELRIATATLFIDEEGLWKPVSTYQLGG